VGEVTTLLRRLRGQNDRRYRDDVLEQTIRPPGPARQRVPSLAKGRRVVMSPMLRERFAFSGTWTHAAGGETWLSVSDMARAWTTRRIQRNLAVSRKYWEGHVLTRHPPERLSLFGMWLEENDATFLVWPEEAGAEPRIVAYSSQHVDEYRNLKAYLRRLVGR